MNTIVLITGCSSGMGMHAAVELAATGATVVATVRNSTRADALCNCAADAGVALVVEELDVTDHDAAQMVVDNVIARYGPISVLVNNAGRGSVATAEQLTMAQIQAQPDVNSPGSGQSHPAGTSRHA